MKLTTIPGVSVDDGSTVFQNDKAFREAMGRKATQKACEEAELIDRAVKSPQFDKWFENKELGIKVKCDGGGNVLAILGPFSEEVSIGLLMLITEGWEEGINRRSLLTQELANDLIRGT